jgi:hypothetical protein
MDLPPLKRGAAPNLASKEMSAFWETSTSRRRVERSPRCRYRRSRDRSLEKLTKEVRSVVAKNCWGSTPHDWTHDTSIHQCWRSPSAADTAGGIGRVVVDDDPQYASILDWQGNFAGDLRWTIEPLIVLLSPYYLARLQRTLQSSQQQQQQQQVEKTKTD